MIKSMTGFGNSQIIDNLLGKLSLEIRSLNHRFLEMAFNLPSGFSYLEDNLREEISKKIKRGRILVSLAIEKRSYEKIAINRGAIKNYHSLLNKIKKQLALKEGLKLDILLGLPGVVSLREIPLSQIRVKSKIKELLKAALKRLDTNRKMAGRVLGDDLKRRNKRLKQRLDAIRKRFRVIIGQRAARIENIEERASFIKTADITEELTLLKFYLDSFKAKLNKSYPVGKELDFLAQEMQREINTLTAKSFDVRIIKDAIEMRSQIEKIREQLQNVE